MSRYLRNSLIFGAALLVPIVPFVLVGELPGERWLSALDANAGRFAAAATGLLVVDIALPVPSSVVVSLSGARLGFLGGACVGWLGLTLGNLLGYALGRLWPARFAPEFAAAPTALVLLLSRPVPILAEAMTLTAGAARVALGPALAACATGNALYVTVLAAVGAAWLPGERMLLALGVVMLIPLAGWSIWRWNSRAVAGNGDHRSESLR
jgi:membrane protein YqaA with SNARE-associated domain